MFIKKISTGLFILTTLNGCVQSSAFLGPAVTGASTGNAYQAGLSYSTNLIVEEFTGKTSIENFQELLVKSIFPALYLTFIKMNLNPLHLTLLKIQ